MAIALSIASEGWGYGILAWLLLLPLAATAVAVTLTWCPRCLRSLAN